MLVIFKIYQNAYLVWHLYYGPTRVYSIAPNLIYAWYGMFCANLIIFNNHQGFVAFCSMNEKIENAGP